MAWVVGVPLGAVIVDYFGWRTSFGVAAVLAVVAAAGVGLLLPAVSNPSLAGGLASRLAVAGRPAVLATLAVTVLTMVSGFTVLTYVRPLLEGLTGFGGEGIGLLLLAFGLAGVGGSILGEEYEVAAGDFMGFPAPGVAHHLRNPYDEDLVYLVGGESHEVEVADFPRLGRRMLRLGQNVEIYDTSDARAFIPLQDEADTSDQP